MTEHWQRRIMALGALGLVFGALFWMATSSLSDDLTYFLSPSELSDRGPAMVGATVRLQGMVETGSVDWNPQEQRLAFRLTDGQATIPVIGTGVPPQMFREGIGAVVEGELDNGGVFRTRKVMVKHDNEYRPPEEGERPEDLYKTLAEEAS